MLCDLLQCDLFYWWIIGFKRDDLFLQHTVGSSLFILNETFFQKVLVRAAKRGNGVRNKVPVIKWKTSTQNENKSVVVLTLLFFFFKSVCFFFFFFFPNLVDLHVKADCTAARRSLRAVSHKSVGTTLSLWNHYSVSTHAPAHEMDQNNWSVFMVEIFLARVRNTVTHHMESGQGFYLILFSTPPYMSWYIDLTCNVISYFRSESQRMNISKFGSLSEWDINT